MFICHLFFLSSHHPTSHLPSCYLAFFPSLCLISQVFPPLIATLVTPPELLFSFCFLLSSTSASLPAFYTHSLSLLFQLTPLSAFISWENATSVLTRRVLSCARQIGWSIYLLTWLGFLCECMSAEIHIVRRNVSYVSLRGTSASDISGFPQCRCKWRTGGDSISI